MIGVRWGLRAKGHAWIHVRMALSKKPEAPFVANRDVEITQIWLNGFLASSLTICCVGSLGKGHGKFHLLGDGKHNSYIRGNSVTCEVHSK